MPSRDEAGGSALGPGMMHCGAKGGAVPEQDVRWAKRAAHWFARRRPSADRPGPGLSRSGLTGFVEVRDDIRISRRLLALARRHLRFLPAMIVLSLLSSLFEGISLTLVIPLVHALDQSVTSADQGRLLTFLQDTLATIPIESRLIAILGAMFVAVLLKSLVSYANLAVLGVVYGRLSHSLRLSVFSKVVEMPLTEFERERSGRLLNVLNNETWRATDALNAVFTIITSLATLIVFVTLLLLLSWRLTMLAFICVAVIPPLVQVLTRHVKRLSEHGLEANEALTKRTWTALSGLRIIHAFGRENFEIKRFEEASDRVRHIFLRMSLISMTTGPITEILITGIVALLALMIDATQVAIGTLVGFLAILYRLQPRLLALVSAQSKLLSSYAPVTEVSDILAAGAIAPIAGERPFAGLRTSIRVDNVTFAHHGAARPALSDVSFGIPAAGMLAIVGPSGAGKSTLLDLLLRFHEPQQGTIWIDGSPLREIEPKSWRSRIAVVSQDPYIFDDTIRANILYGRPEATDAELAKAAHLARADEFIRELPTGYETVVGERGTQISGGQRQRIALARALIRDPDILILDEATNALDTPTEDALGEALRGFAQTRAVIVVAHKLAVIDKAYHVVVLDGGKVVEQGNPRTLLAGDGYFAHIFRLQRLSAARTA
jgi:subfamily B ATP-binding cassette protein MsbA